MTMGFGFPAEHRLSASAEHQPFRISDPVCNLLQSHFITYISCHILVSESRSRNLEGGFKDFKAKRIDLAISSFSEWVSLREYRTCTLA